MHRLDCDPQKTDKYIFSEGVGKYRRVEITTMNVFNDSQIRITRCRMIDHP